MTRLHGTYVASKVGMTLPLTRPLGVPELATFSPEAREWSAGTADADGVRNGGWRFYDEEGALRRAATYERGTLHGLVRRFDHDEVVEQLHYVNGFLEGPYWRRVTGAYRGPCEAAVFEVGTYDRGVRVGTCRLLDANEQEMARFELGRSVADDEILSAGVLSIFPRPTPAWLELSRRAFEDGRVDEGLAALARAVAKGADYQLLESAIEGHTLPTTPDEARIRAAAVAEETSPRCLLVALVAGAEPIAVLRRLATVLAGGVALDMIEAAFAISPDPVQLLFPRALLRALSGNITGARHDARTLKHVRPSEYELLMDAISALDDVAMRVAS